MRLTTRIITASVLALTAILSSCNKSEETAPQGPQDERYNIDVTLGGAAIEVETKTTGEAATISANEAKVNNLQVLVFRGDFLDAYGTAAANSLTVSCTAGTRTIYAIVNGPNLSSVTSLNSLKAMTVDLSANSADSFVMVGSTSTTLPGTKSVNIEVSRLVSRVVIKQITRNFTAPSLQGLTFTVDKIYLVNAAGDINYAKTAGTTKWYNLQEDKNEVPSMLKDTPAASIANNASHSTYHYFYAMPNPATSKTTRLVIEATLGSNKYYYPVDLPALEGNTSYELAGVTIKRSGSDSPDTPVSSDDISFSLTVKGWVPSTINETVI